MAKVRKIIPKTSREVEQFYRDILPKVSDTDSTLSDEEQKSSIPFLGIVQSVERKLERLSRDGRSNRLMIETVARLETENRRLATEVSALKRRVQNIEGEL